MRAMTLTPEDREDAIKNLAAAQVILQRAEVKYRSQSTGGIQRALDSVNAVLNLVGLDSGELVDELETYINAAPAPAPVRRKQLALLGRLRAQLGSTPSLREELAELVGSLGGGPLRR